MSDKKLNPEWEKATHRVVFDTATGMMSHAPNEGGDGCLGCECPDCGGDGEVTHFVDGQFINDDCAECGGSGRTGKDLTIKEDEE